MALKKPESMEECVYMTQRAIGEKGYAMTWVFRNPCPKCKKSTMGKPKDKKTGKVQIRANEYVCPSCGFTMEKTAYEETLTASIEYTCPKCVTEGEIQIPFKRKKVEGAESLIFNCAKCNEKILITKKLKEPKKKG